MTADGVEFIDMKPETSSFRDEVLEGLSRNPKSISPKFFYDEKGSALFNNITKTPEYYVTRVEEEILKSYSTEISEVIGSNRIIVEYGSGNSEKSGILISTLKSPAAYVLIDISPVAVRQSAETLASRFPGIRIVSICADYLRMEDMPESGSQDGTVIVFLGSTIGNFDPESARKFLEDCYGDLDQGDGVLIGVDLKKDVDVLNRAYNDAEGFTAEFNMNLLRRMMNELNADLSLDKFAHKAFYNEEMGRIEMHLISLEDQEILIEENRFHFDRGESIHTESSYKYTVREFSRLAEDSGLKVRTVWHDPDQYFGLFFLSK